MTRQNMEKIALWVNLQKMMNKRLYVTSVTTQCWDSLLWHVWHVMKQWKKCWHWNLIWDKYSLLENKTHQMLKTKRIICYICKSCHLQLQPKCTCVCLQQRCARKGYILKHTTYVDYDFASFVVSQCLGYVSNSGDHHWRAMYMSIMW